MTTVIVGAGQAGGHAAITLRDAGYSGDILLIGDEAERPHERPPLSKQMLTAAEEPPIPYFHADAQYTDRTIRFVPNTRATAIDPIAAKLHVQNGPPLAYDHLLLTTGGRARRLDLPGAERVLTLRTLEDARLLRPLLQPGTRMVCIGAGVIGLEIASSATSRGCTVTVIEPAPTIMSRSLPPILSTWLAALHTTHGVTLRLGTGVTEITPTHVITTDGDAIPAGLVVAGIGMVRNTELAASAGLELDSGIAVDEYGRTSAPGIYAAGDVAAFWVPRLQRRFRLETWRHAQDHGAAVARTIAGTLTPYDEIPWFWTDQHGTNLQMAGTSEGAAHTILRGALDAPSFSVWLLDAAHHPIGVVAINAPRDVRAGQVLIRAARPVDPAQLADTTLSAQKLARL